MEAHRAYTRLLQERMREGDIGLFVAADPDTIYLLSGCWGYLGMEFGRATLLVVPVDGDPVLVTPLMEAEMQRRLTWVEEVREWMDGVDDEWRRPLAALLEADAKARIGVERNKTHPEVLDVAERVAPGRLVDASDLLWSMRMVKSEREIEIMRQAGEVALSMVEAARECIAPGVAEYEVALAVISAGTRKAASLLDDADASSMVSPTIHNLQILQSGRHTCMVHGRSTTRRLGPGDPVYLCFCGIANFKHFKLGFDREFFVSSVTDEQARAYEVTLGAQQAALAEIRPGVIAEDVHLAAEQVYRDAGLAPGYRTGRGIGYSFLEQPELKRGDRTVVEAGMTFAVDGGVTMPGAFGTRVGDSIVVTENGFDYLTPYPRELTVL